MALVMVVDDDQDLAEMLGIVLTSSGFDVDLVSRGDEALEVFRNNPPDLVLLDVMLPGIDGIEVCRLIRQESMVPIVMLSAKGETQDIVRGLEAGADDYMQKPFRDKAELIARIRTRLRRTNADVTGLLTIGDLSIDVTAHEVHQWSDADSAHSPRIRFAGGACKRSWSGIYPRCIAQRSLGLPPQYRYSLGKCACSATSLQN
jgi:two-component system response regulator MtrA